ncbi:MAG: acyl-CoA dehydrogenase [Deltaproteobacteria bacterium]|nr:MAG: acyl-CoA dehydrogenase [Deltaproteobacteria bacterium]
MKIELSEEHRMLQETCRKLADDFLKPNAGRWDEEKRFPQEAVDRLVELGLMGVAIPEEWGGSGMDHIAYVVAMEEVSRGCASTGVIMSVNNSLYCDPVLRYGTEAQKETYLRPFAAGEKLGCFCLTEPQAGSDAAKQKTTAVLDGDHYVLNGSKNWITNGPNADAAIVFAMTEPEKGTHGISAFIVDTDTPGFNVSEPEKKMGIRAALSSAIFLEECRVPKENLLGEPGKGFKVAMSTLDGGRIGIAAQALGIAQAAFELARDYALEREAFGGPIAKLQAIQFKLADMATRLEAARMLTYRAAWMKDRKVRHSKESAMAKLYASEMATFVTHQAQQILGGNGYSLEYPAERHYRDARITEIYEGTSEIQRLVIASNVLGVR